MSYFGVACTLCIFTKCNKPKIFSKHVYQIVRISPDFFQLILEQSLKEILQETIQPVTRNGKHASYLQ